MLAITITSFKSLRNGSSLAWETGTKLHDHVTGLTSLVPRSLCGIRDMSCRRAKPTKAPPPKYDSVNVQFTKHTL